MAPQTLAYLGSNLKTVFETCEPRPEVLTGELKEEIFAARLKDVMDGKADPVYQDPPTFFDNTYPTEGLRLLLDEALGRLTGLKPANNAIIRLETAFGGGKTHNLIALYHAAYGFTPGPTFVDSALIPRRGAARVVGVVGSDLQPRDGLDHGDATTYTLWGELAYQLGGAAGYAHAAGGDQDRSAPGTRLLEKLIGDDTALIMLDEIARHLRAAKTVPTATGRITGDAERLSEFHVEQRKKLKKISEAAELDVRVAITKTYRYLYYPSADAPQRHSVPNSVWPLAREALPPQDQGEVNQDQSNVVLRVLKQLQKVLTADDPTLPAAFVKAKAWDAGQASLSTEELGRAFARRMGLRILLDLNQLKKTMRNGVSQGTWIYYNTAEQIGYGSASPAPMVQISDDVILYTPEEAARLNLHIKGVGGNGGEPELTCPVCGRPQSQCICGQACPVCGQDPCVCERRVRLHAEGAPARAFQGLLDQCHDQSVSSLGRIFVRIEGRGREGATEARAMGLAIPQLGKGQYRVEQSFNAEFGEGESLSVAFNGDWDRYKRLKQVTDAFGQEASKLLARTTLRADFPDGLAVDSDQFQTIHEVFTTLGFGRMVLDAEPLET